MGAHNIVFNSAHFKVSKPDRKKLVAHLKLIKVVYMRKKYFYFFLDTPVNTFSMAFAFLTAFVVFRGTSKQTTSAFVQ